MKRTPVKSTNIKAVGYDADKRVMEVEFTNGGVYHYLDVDPHEHQALVKAKSVGKHFGAHFRGRSNFGRGEHGKTPE